MPGETPTNPASQASLAGAPLSRESMHEDLTAKWFMLSSITYFFIVGIIALTIAAKFVWPQLARHRAIFDLRPPASAACQRHAVRLAAPRRHGPDLLYCSRAFAE